VGLGWAGLGGGSPLFSALVGGSSIAWCIELNGRDGWALLGWLGVSLTTISSCFTLLYVYCTLALCCLAGTGYEEQGRFKNGDLFHGDIRVKARSLIVGALHSGAAKSAILSILESGVLLPVKA
jgi:hypothetical protein